MYPDEDGEILDMIAGEDGSFILGAEDEVDATPTAVVEPLTLQIDGPATVAVASFGIGILLGVLLKRRMG